MLSTIWLDIWEPHPHNCRNGRILDNSVTRTPDSTTLSGELWNFVYYTFRNFITHSVIWKADSMTLRRAAHERGVTCIRHSTTSLDIPGEGKRIPWWRWCGRAAHERRVFCVCCEVCSSRFGAVCDECAEESRGRLQARELWLNCATFVVVVFFSLCCVSTGKKKSEKCIEGQ